MRLTFSGARNERFVVDGATLASGESTIVADERGETLLREYPDVLKGAKTPASKSASKDSQGPSTKAAQPSKGIAPPNPEGD